MLRVQAGVPLQVPDLAEALDGNYGTFYAECNGQGFIVTSERGHSIVSLRPVGRRIIEQPSANLTSQRSWFVEKLSDETFGKPENERPAGR